VHRGGEWVDGRAFHESGFEAVSFVFLEFWGVGGEVDAAERGVGWEVSASGERRARSDAMQVRGRRDGRKGKSLDGEILASFA